MNNRTLFENKAMKRNDKGKDIQMFENKKKEEKIL